MERFFITFFDNSNMLQTNVATFGESKAECILHCEINDGYNVIAILSEDEFFGNKENYEPSRLAEAIKRLAVL